jgi:hypothetical protein
VPGAEYKLNHPQPPTSTLLDKIPIKYQVLGNINLIWELNLLRAEFHSAKERFNVFVTCANRERKYIQIKKDCTFIWVSIPGFRHLGIQAIFWIQCAIEICNSGTKGIQILDGFSSKFLMSQIAKTPHSFFQENHFYNTLHLTLEIASRHYSSKWKLFICWFFKKIRKTEALGLKSRLAPLVFITECIPLISIYSKVHISTFFRTSSTIQGTRGTYRIFQPSFLPRPPILSGWVPLYVCRY